MATPERAITVLPPPNDADTLVTTSGGVIRSRIDLASVPIRPA